MTTNKSSNKSSKKREGNGFRVEIWAEFGSDFQREVNEAPLRIMLETWVQHMMARHKKNKAIVEISELPPNTKLPKE